MPYDARGRRLPEGSTAPRMWLDLRLGAKIKLTAGHNHQGAKQPSTMHVGARKGQKFHGEALLPPIHMIDHAHCHGEKGVKHARTEA